MAMDGLNSKMRVRIAGKQGRAASPQAAVRHGLYILYPEADTV